MAVPAYAHGTQIPTLIFYWIMVSYNPVSSFTFNTDRVLDLFADHFGGDYDEDMFAGLWDDLPWFGLAQPDQVVGQPVRPPPAPGLKPIRQRFPYHLPPPVVNQPMPAAVQAGNAQWANPYIPAVVPPAFGWNGGPAQLGGQVIADIPRRVPKAGDQQPQPPAALDHEASFAGQQRRLQGLRNNVANLQQKANGVQPQQTGNIPAQNRMGPRQRKGGSGKTKMGFLQSIRPNSSGGAFNPPDGQT